MEGVKFLETIRLENILSYGPNAEPFPLEPLNVLIGPNGSGKSNLIEALSLLQSAPWDLQERIRWGGGVTDWLWKGSPGTPTATIDVTVGFPLASRFGIPLRYQLSFTEAGGRFWLVDEVVEQDTSSAPTYVQPYLYYRYRFQDGRPVIDVVTTTAENRTQRRLQWDDVRPDQSVLSQRRDSFTYPELTYLAIDFRRVRFYGDWDLRKGSPPRLPQRTDLYQADLLDDASNIVVLLSNLLNQPGVKECILERMRDFYPSFHDVTATLVSGAAQIFFHEKGVRQPIPATRISDGSLHYLCLLAVLCHPTPPPVVCIEEPERGLHPDAISELGKLLLEASSRCQLFVTTHSDLLVDALTEVPEAVIVCEKPESATQLRRLSAAELDPWLEKYRLGDLWIQGQIGGTRW